ncbi:MAG: beta-ketoacyl-[acyl-carrier-protein] synthase family protein [Gallionella sp.]
MKKRRVVITGLGLINPYGEGDVQDFFSRSMRGESAIRYHSLSKSPRPLSLPLVACTHFNPIATLGPPLANAMDRFSHFALASALSAWADSGLTKHCNRDDYGVSWGTGSGGSLTIERAYQTLYFENKERVSPLSVVLAMNNSAASHIAMQLGLGGPCNTSTVACASSAVAIGEAFRRIREGAANLMLVGGSEAPLSYGVIRAWQAMRVLSEGDESTAYRASRPFSADRAGLTLAEGGAALVIEDWEHAHARGARIYAEIVGYGSTCDHTHIARPDSAGQVRAIAAALQDGELHPDEIDYVNAHGTATVEGDAIEIQSIKTVFGEHARKLAVSSTKSMHGHSLGAASAIEALITTLALYHQSIPPTANVSEIGVDCAGVDHVVNQGRSNVPVRTALSNSFAFGGSNAVLAFRSVAT